MIEKNYRIYRILGKWIEMAKKATSKSGKKPTKPTQASKNKSSAAQHDLTPGQLQAMGIGPEDYKEAGEICMEFLNDKYGHSKSNVDLCTKILDAQKPGEKFSQTLRRLESKGKTSKNAAPKSKSKKISYVMIAFPRSGLEYMDFDKIIQVAIATADSWDELNQLSKNFDKDATYIVNKYQVESGYGIEYHSREKIILQRMKIETLNFITSAVYANATTVVS